MKKEFHSCKTVGFGYYYIASNTRIEMSYILNSYMDQGYIKTSSKNNVCFHPKFQWNISFQVVLNGTIRNFPIEILPSNISLHFPLLKKGQARGWTGRRINKRKIFRQQESSKVRDEGDRRDRR
jgi:hypothetical protein